MAASVSASLSKPSRIALRASSPRAARSSAVPLVAGSGSSRSGPVSVGGLGAVAGLGHRLDAQQRRTGLDLAAGLHQQLAHPPGERRVQDGLHLHGLQHQHRGAGGDLVAHRDRGGHDQRGGRGAEHAALVAGDPVRDAVDLDQLHRPVGGGDQAEPLATDRQRAVELVEEGDLRLGDLRDVADGDGDAVAGRAVLQHGDLVRRAPQLELDGPAGLVLGVGATAAGGLEEVVDLEALLVLVGVDRRGDQRDAGVPVRVQPALGADPVDPAGVRPADVRCRR